MPATSRAITQMLSPTPIKNSNAKIRLNHGVIPARSAARARQRRSGGQGGARAQAIEHGAADRHAGKAAERERGDDLRRGARAHGERRCQHRDGGTIIDHMPASSALV